MKRVADIRRAFIDLAEEKQIAENGTLEIVNASFLADEPTIFGKINKDYIMRELEWYLSESLKVTDIRPPIPSIWSKVASRSGEINSNYGWCVFSEANFRQFQRAMDTLIQDKNSRQAALIYTRPTMHADAKRDGMHDFMCTYATQFIIRGNKLHHIIFMRSNDVVFGYRNDKAWQDYVHQLALLTLKHYHFELELGDCYWNAASLHIYEQHFDLVKP